MRSISMLFLFAGLVVSCNGGGEVREQRSSKGSYMACLPWDMVEVKYFVYEVTSSDSVKKLENFFGFDSEGHMIFYSGETQFYWHHYEGSVYCLLQDVHDFLISNLGMSDKGYFDYLSDIRQRKRGLLILNTNYGKSYKVRFALDDPPKFLVPAISKLNNVNGGAGQKDANTDSLMSQVKALEARFSR